MFNNEINEIMEKLDFARDYLDDLVFHEQYSLDWRERIDVLEEELAIRQALNHIEQTLDILDCAEDAVNWNYWRSKI